MSNKEYEQKIKELEDSLSAKQREISILKEKVERSQSCICNLEYYIREGTDKQWAIQEIETWKKDFDDCEFSKNSIKAC